MKEKNKILSSYYFQSWWFSRKTHSTQESSYAHSYSLLQRKNTIKISKGKRQMGQNLGETRCKLPGDPSQCSCMGVHFTLPATMWHNTFKALPTTETHWALTFRVLTEIQSHRYVTPVWLTSTTQILFPMAKADIHHE